MIIAEQFFTLPEHLPFREFFLPELAPWEWIPQIKNALAQFNFAAAPAYSTPPNCTIEGDVYIHPSVKIIGSVCIQGPAYIGEGCELRNGAFIRGNVIVGKHCVIGNSCELKNCLLMDHVETPHYNYVGDSILGNYAHLAAGVILANLRLDKKNISVQTPDGRIETGLRKMGTIFGDHAQAGCNAVLQPGTLLGKDSMVLPLTAFGGYLKAKGIGRKS